MTRHAMPGSTTAQAMVLTTAVLLGLAAVGDSEKWGHGIGVFFVTLGCGAWLLVVVARLQRGKAAPSREPANPQPTSPTRPVSRAPTSSPPEARWNTARWSDDQLSKICAGLDRRKVTHYMDEGELVINISAESVARRVIEDVESAE